MATNELAGKVAVVTGSSRGLGRHYAHALASRGANVAIHDIDENAAARFGEAESGYQVAREIRSMGCAADFFTADLTRPEQVRALVKNVNTAMGHIDILVNNAGGDMGAISARPEPNSALDIQDADIQSVLDRNILTTILTCKYAGRSMRERRSGKIINIGSVAGHAPATEGIVYAAAKAGIAHFTRCLAEELRPYDVNVNCVAPGATYSGRFRATRTVPDERGLSALQRTSQPDDVANIILFLAGPLSNRLTGETIVCW